MKKEKDQKSSDFLGVDIEKNVEELVEEPKEDKKEEEPTPVQGNALEIDDLDNVMKRVLEIEEEKRLNPEYIGEGDAGNVFIHGEPHIAIDNQYVPYVEAQVILQTRKVVSEWLKLQRLKKELNNK